MRPAHGTIANITFDLIPYPCHSHDGNYAYGVHSMPNPVLTLADQFAATVVDFVYEGDKTEDELATFIDRDVVIDRVFGPGGAPIIWLTFSDDSFAMCAPNKGTPFVGTIEGDEKSGRTINC